MAVTKKSTKSTVHPRKTGKKPEELEKPVVANVFDDVAATAAPAQPKPARSRVVVEVEEEETRPLESEQAEEHPHTSLTPSFEPPLTAPTEPELPSFFASDLQTASDQPEESNVEEVSESFSGRDYEPSVEVSDATTQEVAQVIGSSMPQAVVSEINEVSDDIKSEKRTLIGAILIGVAVLLLGAAGLAALYKSGGFPSGDSGAAPQPISIVPSGTATPSPSPTASVSASPSASVSAELAQLKKTLAVSVLNGTKISGLAGKTASTLKSAGYTVTNGNGDPENAGTIEVPEGATVVGDDIIKLLSNFEFIVQESKTAKKVTVTLSEPKQ